jgi:hypothetical protein
VYQNQNVCTYNVIWLSAQGRTCDYIYMMATHKTVTHLTEKVKGHGHKLYGQLFIPLLIQQSDKKENQLLWGSYT